MNLQETQQTREEPIDKTVLEKKPEQINTEIQRLSRSMRQKEPEILENCQFMYCITSGILILSKERLKVQGESSYYGC